jgi:hypothetical protein
MKKYYQIENYGHGFITHEENEQAHIAGYPGNIWVTENTTWPQRVGAVEKTKEEAQLIVDNAVSSSYVPQNEQNNQPIIILP